MKRFDFETQGNRIAVRTLRTTDSLWLHYQGKTRQIALRKTGSGRRTTEGTHKPGEIAAPMPGKITQIKKVVGDLVQTGDVVLVMEAMKMEYSLKASVEGSVREIRCRPGEQVTEDSVLVIVEPKGQSK